MKMLKVVIPAFLLLVCLFPCTWSQRTPSFIVDGICDEWNEETESFPALHPDGKWYFSWISLEEFYVCYSGPQIYETDLTNLELRMFVDTNPSSPNPLNATGLMNPGVRNVDGFVLPFLANRDLQVRNQGLLDCPIDRKRACGGGPGSSSMAVVNGSVEFRISFSPPNTYFYLVMALLNSNKRIDYFPGDTFNEPSQTFTDFFGFFPLFNTIEKPNWEGLRNALPIPTKPHICLSGGCNPASLPLQWEESYGGPDSGRSLFQISGKLDQNLQFKSIWSPELYQDFQQLSTMYFEMSPNGYFRGNELCCPDNSEVIALGDATFEADRLKIPVIRTTQGIIRIVGNLQIKTLFEVSSGVEVIGDSPLYSTEASLKYIEQSNTLVGPEWSKDISNVLLVQSSLLLPSGSYIVSGNITIDQNSQLSLANELNITISQAIWNYGRLYLNPNVTIFGTLKNIGSNALLDRRGVDIQCPTFEIDVSYENVSKQCGNKIEVTVLQSFFGNVSIEWFNGETANVLTSLPPGEYNFTYSEKDADGSRAIGCPMKFINASNNICEFEESVEPVQSVEPEGRQANNENNEENFYENTAVISGISVGILLLLALCIGFLAFFLVRRNKKQKRSSDLEMRSSVKSDIEDFSNVRIIYSDLKIGKMIGSGAFGEVYKGVYRSTPCAIKKLTGKNEDISEFLQEATTMIKLPPHPNVVLFRGMTLPPDPITIVIDFCDGGSLHSLLRKRQLSENEKLQFALGIAKGMLHIHTAIKGSAVIHRDLAARNILLQGSKALIADFGMARVREGEDSGKTNQEIGPLKWMAPEAFLKREYSVKSDSFSFGVVLYEIVTQNDPWPGMNAVEASHAVAKGERMSIPSECPSILRELMTNCWEEDPINRPNFDEICKRLSKEDSEYQSPDYESADIAPHDYMKSPSVHQM